MYNIEIMGVFFWVFVGKWFIYYSLIHLIMTFAIKFIIIYYKVKNQSKYNSISSKNEDLKSNKRSESIVKHPV